MLCKKLNKENCLYWGIRPVISSHDRKAMITLIIASDIFHMDRYPQNYCLGENLLTDTFEINKCLLKQGANCLQLWESWQTVRGIWPVLTLFSATPLPLAVTPLSLTLNSSLSPAASLEMQFSPQNSLLWVWTTSVQYLCTDIPKRVPLDCLQCWVLTF